MKAFALVGAACALFVAGISSSFAQVKMCDSMESRALPVGTTPQANPDGSLSVTVPEGWFIFTEEQGRWTSTPTAIVRGSCPGGSGCSSTLLPSGQTSCAMDSDCTQCNRSGSSAIYPVREDLVGVTFASKDEVESLPRADARLMTIPEIRKDLLAFKRALGIANEAEGRETVWIRLYGYVAPMDVPDGYEVPMSSSATKNIALGLLAAQSIQTPAAALKCSCNSGGSCKLESNFGVKVCNASNCADCSMSH
ncbi:hypothetical protein [Pseudoxanthomonas composti]|uniref:Uncharacterized protein n=1 Tax=Pseudoxanthomonas composti TaxID=2137479 RepID=A0A4Q1JTZ9_9GAMM|nr:hypothetical protein [Pseudoxanthomonas composti]RXR05152.1 hypothetical protein EPA99_10325 [Pseudoxanthomonas composti]